MTRKAFLVEDNPIIRQGLVSAMVDLADAEVVAFAETQDDAVDWMARNVGLFDIVVLDMFLREGNGLGVLRSIRASGLDVPVVVMTNHATLDMRARCENAGATAFFDKSRQTEEFFDYLNAMPTLHAH